ncbi:MAG TPA: DoxX family protein [bacterium]|nr:DoxX family protein [bacterium]
MQLGTQTASGSKSRLWTGRIVSTVAVLFLLLDGALHVMMPAQVVQAFARLGYPVSLAPTLGILEIVCVVVYVFPRTSILGAILLTGYLGGATATQVRVGSPLFAEALFPVYIGVLIWGGLCLREDQLRVLIPLRR